MHSNELEKIRIESGCEIKDLKRRIDLLEQINENLTDSLRRLSREIDIERIMFERVQMTNKDLVNTIDALHEIIPLSFWDYLKKRKEIKEYYDV